MAFRCSLAMFCGAEVQTKYIPLRCGSDWQLRYQRSNRCVIRSAIRNVIDHAEDPARSHVQFFGLVESTNVNLHVVMYMYN